MAQTARLCPVHRVCAILLIVKMAAHNPVGEKKFSAMAGRSTFGAPPRVTFYFQFDPLWEIDHVFFIKGEVKAKIKISPVVVFGVLSRMVVVRGS